MVDRMILPRHVAIIMDGNGRWAQAKGLIRSAGHLAGVNSLKQIVQTAVNINLECLTIYAFSTENWKRPASEVDFLMQLFSEFLNKEKAELNQKNVKIKFIGRIDELPQSLINLANESEQLMSFNTGLKFNVATNYGGQDEIVRATKKICSKVINNEISIDDINQSLFESQLDTANQPPIDLLIRTGGDFRISNFLLWQSAYAEFWFTDKNFPDFSPDDFLLALNDFAKRDRRFGNVK